MQQIQGHAKTVRQLLSVKYAIDYYQREYKWETKQIQELLEDLTGSFLDDYRPEHPRQQVKTYGRYFLGSIIISTKDGANYIVDGQQRLTSLTLLLIFLRNRQQGLPGQVGIDSLIYSEQYGAKSFNLHVEERTPAMEALFDGKLYEEPDAGESVQNILGRYRDIVEYFPPEIDSQALPYFVDWLIDNVHLVEITAYADDDAYTIFETMNDRGLSLTPADMLKGFLIANIADSLQKTQANDLWKERTQELRQVSKETEPDFFKAWLRSQYALRIRERRKGAKPEDFDRIGTEFHRWVRQHADEKGDDELVLKTSSDFFRFVRRDFDYYSRQYLRLMRASTEMVPRLEHVFYNARYGFTLQYMLLLAPLTPDDADQVAQLKQRLVAMFVDILLARRIWNFRSIAYSTMQYAMFLVMRGIRGMDPHSLAHHLYEALGKENETFASNEWLRMHQQNRYQLHHLLARMTDWVEQESGLPSHFRDYVAETGNNRFEVEHIWANKPDEHLDEFGHPQEFAEARDRFGGLLLLPKSFNASFGALPYEQKLKHYNKQNLLAQSLHPDTYERNPQFLAVIKRTGLPFRAHPEFKRADMKERQVLYRRIAERIWDPELLLADVAS